MSDFARANSGGATHFTDKDALSSGDSSKVIVGSQFDAEFQAIVTASASKYDSDDRASQAQAEAETLNTVLITPLRLANWADTNGGMVGDIQALADPGADRLLGWDDSAGAAIGFAAGTGLALSGTNLNLSHLGIESLTDPGGDRILFWDDGAGAAAWLAVSTGLTLTGTTLTADFTVAGHDTFSDFVANEHIDHSAVTLTAGLGISGGGTIAANRSFAIDFSEFTSLTMPNFSQSADSFIVDNAGVPNIMAYADAGIKVATVIGTTDILATGDMNTFIEYTNAGAVAVTLNTGVGTVGNVVIIKQTGAGQVTVSGTATLESAVGNRTRTTDSVIVLVCIAADTWSVYGDMAS